MRIAYHCTRGKLSTLKLRSRSPIGVGWSFASASQCLCVSLYNWCSSLPDDSLTPHTLLPAVSTVTEFWETDDDAEYAGLLQGLGVPHSVNDDIRANPSYPTEEEKRVAGLQYYLQTVPGALWERLAGELWSLEEHTALEEVRQYLPSTHGEWLGEFPFTLTLGVHGVGLCIHHQSYS